MGRLIDVARTGPFNVQHKALGNGDGTFQQSQELGDGKADILWRNAKGTTRIRLMDGSNDVGGGYAEPQLASDWQIR